MKIYLRLSFLAVSLFMVSCTATFTPAKTNNANILQGINQKEPLGDTSQVKVILDLQISPTGVVLKEHILNPLSHPIYLPPHALPVRVRRVKDGLKLHYISMQAKRKPYTWEEFIRISPQASYTRTFKLNEIYGFPQGCYDYQLKDYKGYFYPNEDTIIELGMESKDFTWCNPHDPFHGFFNDPLAK